MVRKRPAPDGVATERLDLANRDSCAALDVARFDAVIHAAALADADQCERDPKGAASSNEEATRNLVALCAETGTRFIFVSTDLVFDGSKSHWHETDQAEPVMEYGRTKKRAEDIVLKSSLHAPAVVRVSLLSGRGFGARRSCTESIADRLTRSENKTPMALYDDEWRTPVDVDSVAPVLLRLAERRDIGGVFHLGGPERLTRLELGRRVKDLLSLGGPSEEVFRTASRLAHVGAARPQDVSLDSSRAVHELGYKPRPLNEAIRAGRKPTET